MFNPCGNDTIMQDVTAVTGIHELNQLKGEMILYPNPTKGHFTIEYPAAPGENIRLMVYNLLGQEIYSESLRGLKVANGHVISLEDINAGSYIVRLISEEGVIENLVIIQ
ncbi:MAG: T9SS type A sorting domain-containing protein [Bacteroidetes bacterium]|nr:T9SS type A sorting domain-containing protein [Bacteroidota bacterium]